MKMKPSWFSGAALIFIRKIPRPNHLIFAFLHRYTNMNPANEFETIAGLEVHARLLTQSKLFSTESAIYGEEPNTAVSPVTLAHPGALPVLNKKAIELAIRTGLACHCEIEKKNYFVRKNYFYPDLPKGYQVTQHTTPICRGGYISIRTSSGKKNIRLNRIHLEEDAGKSLHDTDDRFTSVDLNRAGTALIEIVTEPDVRSADEAYAFLSEIRKLLRYLDVCDGNMEEGSLRCDVNISVRKKGEQDFGTKVEIKNLNSIRFVKQAIEAESARLIQLLQNGESVQQQTRSFDAAAGETFSIREKEDAEDYRYFPEPDLTPFQLTDAFMEDIRRSMPELQEEKMQRFISEYGLSKYDAAVLTDDKNFSDYYEEIIKHLNAVPSSTENASAAPPYKGVEGSFKLAANWMLGPVKSWLNEHHEEINRFPVVAEKTAELILLVESGKVNFSVASSRIFPALLAEPEKKAAQLAEEMNLIQRSDVSFLEPLIDAVLHKYPEKVQEYKKGKKGLLSMFVGEVIKASRGRAEPKLVNELLKNKLKS